MASHLYREVEKELRESAVPYRIEVGGKHCKVFIGGKLVMTFSRGGGKSKDTLYLKRMIRKYLAQTPDERIEKWSPSSAEITVTNDKSPAGSAHPY